jgi:SulP family sulfate permease
MLEAVRRNPHALAVHIEVWSSLGADADTAPVSGARLARYLETVSNAAFFIERLETLITNAGPGLKCVILDAEAISDFDSTAAEALETLDVDLERQGVDLWIARANGPLRDLLTATGLMKRLGADHIYPSVRAAVTAYQAQFSPARQ